MEPQDWTTALVIATSSVPPLYWAMVSVTGLSIVRSVGGRQEIVGTALKAVSFI